ncbi:MAG: carboxypeptidase regulatory-like domain-containing protein [bacterium]|nr:carboxypeptidase regulatory-like domain-containing protein [bacterium]
MLLALALVAVATVPVWARPDEVPAFFLDPATGELGGHRAVVVYAVAYADGRLDHFHDPRGFEVHFVPLDALHTELVFPSGQWFRPPAQRRYRAWVEGNWQMSPYGNRLSYRGGPFEGRGMVGAFPIVPAGRVALPAEYTDPGLVLRLFRATAHREGDLAREELVRELATTELGEGLLMPVGPVIAGLWHRSTGRLRGLSRPFDAIARDTVEVSPRRPKEHAHLLVRLARPTGARMVEDYDVALTLSHAGVRRPPDVVAPAARSVLAAWYDLPPGPSTLRAGSDALALPPMALDLGAGTVEYVSADLAARPALDVQLDLPARLNDGSLVLAVKSLRNGTVVRRQPLSAGAGNQRFERLPLATLEVALETPLGTFARQVDLSAGQDDYVLLAPELILVSGTVYHGEEGHPASMRFETTGRAASEAEADKSGFYELLLMEPLRSVTIDLTGTERAPYFDFFPKAIAEDTVLDFHLPDAVVEVNVLDAITGDPIPGASIILRNTFVERGADNPPLSEDERRKREKAVNQQMLADESGAARLPPLREGRLEARATAEGYRAMLEPLELEIESEMSDQFVELLLEPFSDTARLRLSLPDGAPAAGAEVMMVDTLAGGRQLFASRADMQGILEIPGGSAAGILLSRHPSAGFAVRPWQPVEGEGEIALDLPPRAPQALRVRILDSAGRDPVAGAGLALWVDGWRLSGSVLAWLTGTRPTADQTGLWMASNLPRASLAILSWATAKREDAYAGRLDALATPVASPWPEQVDVYIVE